MMHKFLTLGACAALSACGGSSDSNISEVGRAAATTYNEHVDGFFAVVDNSTPADLLEIADRTQVTQPSSLPVSGEASYRGVAYFEFTSIAEAETELLADMTLRADFSDATVSGRMENFISNRDESYAGTLSIEEGDIDRATDTSSQFTYIAGLEGTLTAPSGTQFASDAFIAGEFVGEDPDFVRGYVRGGLLEGARGESILLNDTLFVGERQ